MSLFLTRRPGRWVRNCIIAESDPCDNLNQADWNPVAWVLSGGGFAGVYVLPNLVDGLIASIDSYPTGTYFSGAGLPLGTLTYNSGLGYYTTTSEISPDFTQYVLINDIPVTLIDGSSCSVDFKQYFSNTIEVPAPANEWSFTTNIGGALGFFIYTSVGTVDWGDGTVDAYDASAGSDNPAHTLAAGTFVVKIFNGFNTTRIDAQNEGMLSLDLQRAGAWTDIDFSNNANLASIVWPQVHNVLTTNINLAATGITNINLTSLTRKGGLLTASNSPSLTNISLGTSSDVINDLQIKNCDLTGVMDISGLTLAGVLNMENNPNLTGIIIGTQTGIFTELDFNSCDLLTIDLSGCTGLGAKCLLSDNFNMTTANFPTSSQVFTQFKINNAAIPSLNISGLTGLAGDFQAQNIAELTTFTAPTSSGVFSRFYIFSCDITGTLVLSGLTGLGGNIRFYGNSNLTAFTPPVSSQAITHFYAYSCGLTSLDLSNLTGLGGEIKVNLNSGMTSLILPTSAVTTTELSAQSNDLGYFDLTGMTLSSALTFKGDNNTWTTTEINHMLVDLEATLPGTGTGTLTMAGDNSAPDGSAGGYDGRLAKDNLIAAGYTITTN